MPAYQDILSTLDRTAGHRWRTLYIDRFGSLPTDVAKCHYSNTKAMALMCSKGDISHIDAAHHVRCFAVSAGKNVLEYHM